MTRSSTPKGEKRYGWRFIVVGYGNFPTDMLRYDECFPVDESEARGMFSPNLECRTVRLERWSGHPNPPTARRWESQGWRVICCEAVRGGFHEASDFWTGSESHVLLYKDRMNEEAKEAEEEMKR